MDRASALRLSYVQVLNIHQTSLHASPRNPLFSLRCPPDALHMHPRAVPHDTHLSSPLAHPPSFPQTFSPHGAHPHTLPFAPLRASRHTHRTPLCVRHIPHAAPRRTDGARSLPALLCVHLCRNVSAVG